MDAFFASVEIRDAPQLKHRPVAVGGDPQSRGVIAAANYVARKYGIHSAMPSWKAKKLCPDLIIIPPNIEKYKRESEAIFAIFRRFTDLIEPLSLDEAFLDVSSVPSATHIAQEIRHLIATERHLTASAGVAPNKFLSKIASDWNKPDGLFVITPDAIDDFIKDLPIEKIFGVGKVTANKLHHLNIATCRDLQKLDINDLEHHFGNRGDQLYQLARGIDNRPVQPHRIRKSISVEDTYPTDLGTLEECLHQVAPLYDRLMKRYHNLTPDYRAAKLNVKIKFYDFTATTVESHLYTIPELSSFQELIKIGWQRRQKPVRLLGLGIALATDKEQQLSFF